MSTLRFPTAVAVFVAGTFAAAPALAKPGTWEIDPSHSTVGFSVRHLGVSDVRGAFGTVTGTVVYDPENVQTSTVTATVGADSVNTREPKRDGHLKSPDFFDVAKFPSLTFKSKKVVKTATGVAMSGDLTIHGVTKEVTFAVTGPTPPVKDPFVGKMHSGAKAEAKINRKDFGLTWNKAIESGGVVVGEEVYISLDVELVSK